ncbi:MAG: TrkA family potassium uptake protein [Clostridiaceae bacterium]
MKILLVGGHQKANFLIKSLKARGHDITVINEDYEWCNMLTNTHEVISVNGDGTKPYVLEDARASKMDAVIALSNKDSANLIVCEIAKKQFHVKNTVAVVNDPNNVKMFKELGVNKCISATQMLADVIEQDAITENLKSYMPMENGKVVISEIELDDKSPVLNKKLWEIGFPKDSTVGCIIRTDQTIIPQGNTELKAGDKVILLSSPEVLENITLLLSGGKAAPEWNM